MRILGIIPSRFASTRFPGKPLADILGKPMIKRVYEQASKSTSLNELIVATDDQRIYDEVERFDGHAVMTSPDHRNGTERCAEVAEMYPDFDFIINIQGDEPFIQPEQIDQLASLLNQEVQIATLIKAVEKPEVLDDPLEMKVVVNQQFEALYFSRNCIPHLRDIPLDERLHHHTFYKHIGLYAYRPDILRKIVKLHPTPLEIGESLEQLRWLENGFRICTGVTSYDSRMIDTQEELAQLIIDLNL